MSEEAENWSDDEHEVRRPTDAPPETVAKLLSAPIPVDCAKQTTTTCIVDALSRSLRLEVATKQRIIDEVLAHLQQCMREKSLLQIQNDVLQAKLNSEKIEGEKLAKSCHWYRTQLHESQRLLRLQASAQNDSRRAHDTVQVRLLKSLSECEILGERLSLEKAKRCSPQLQGNGSKDSSGVFSELESSSDTSDVADECPMTQAPPSHADELRSAVSLCQALRLQLEKSEAEREMWCQQNAVKASLLCVQTKSIDQLQGELSQAHESLVAQQQAHATTTENLAKCRQRLQQLMADHDDVHRESMHMVVKFEKTASCLAQYWREARAQDEDQLRGPHGDRSSSQANEGKAVTRDQGVQSDMSIVGGSSAQDPGSAYYRNLVAVVERECQHKLRRSEASMRTLVKKLKEEMRRGKELELRHQQLRHRVSVLPPQESTPPLLSKAMVTQQDAVIAQLEEECGHRGNLLEQQRVQLDALKEEIGCRTECMARSTQTIHELEREQQTYVRMEQERLLLLQTRNEKDDLVCQNEELKRVLRGLLFVQEQHSPVMAKANVTLKRCASYKVGPATTTTLQPLSKAIESLQQEVKSLNCAVLWRNCGEVSLHAELQAVIGEV